MQKKDKAILKGALGFNEYYSKLFGARWETLKNALLKENNLASWSAAGITSNNSKEITSCHASAEPLKIAPYFLDAASITAAASLPLCGAKNILDMCASPGGKSLVISSIMERDATLTCNEKSYERKCRLVRVLDEYCLPDVRQRINVTCEDGAVLCKKKDLLYDRILLDAPCSSERHVIKDSKYLNLWSPARIKTLSLTQWALLSSAFRLLKQGGFILYSTCALNNLENDDVIFRLLKKFPESARIVERQCCNVSKWTPCTLPEGERTKYGFHILPDKTSFGPIYYSLIQKI